VDPAQQALGHRLRTCRELAGLSQQAVAASAGIPRTAISDIERGYRKVDVMELKRFALVYNQTVAFLAGEDDEDDGPISGERSLRQLTRAHAGLTDNDRQALVAFAQFLQHGGDRRAKE